MQLLRFSLLSQLVGLLTLGLVGSVVAPLVPSAASNDEWLGVFGNLGSFSNLLHHGLPGQAGIAEARQASAASQGSFSDLLHHGIPGQPGIAGASDIGHGLGSYQQGIEPALVHGSAAHPVYHAPSHIHPPAGNIWSTEPWHDQAASSIQWPGSESAVDDRNPDDLSAVVFGARYHPASHEQQVLPPARAIRQATPSVRASASTSESAPQILWPFPSSKLDRHAFISSLQEADPMEMVKRPVLIVTQEEDLEEEIRNEVHPSLELKSVWNAERPKLLARHDSHDAFVDAFSYLRVEHLGIELVFGGRKFWLMKVHRVPASLNSPTLTGLYVWELKTFEGQAVLVCRGMYSAGKRFWGHLKKSAEVGAKQSFMFRAKQDPVSGADIFHAWKANPSTFVAPTDSQPWRTSLANAGLRPDADSRFVYRPDPWFNQAFAAWIAKNGPTTSRYHLGPPLQLGAEYQDLFSLKMRESFRRRVVMTAITLEGETFLATHHPPDPAFPTFDKAFVALWSRQHELGPSSLVAKGLYHMHRPYFDAAVRKADGASRVLPGPRPPNPV
ncbi:hypothetical protein PANT_8c00122 [Moesziomyces antarcticus T-34]|uniref:Uncharacterized protein n=1 Tax=Pseudozyma antarctica (strain T-34) TaxID=1151754 RepID=M9MC38_PSEA3|nr:hypothetical protein PANT_8c00122 [Moesziomyces antarcticus T-34]